MRRNIIIDCDPGIDDAIAITLAIANSDKLNILGITTVAGNQDINKVTNNALMLTSFLQSDIRVARGADCPLIRQKKVADYVHGSTGLGNYQLPSTDKKKESVNAIVFLRNEILNSKEKVTLVPIGPLTNIALLLKTFPEVKENIDEIVMMGGGINFGNVSKTAEYNIWADPEAAKIVFASKVKIVMNGLDVTTNTGLYKHDVEGLLTKTGKISNMCGQILDFYFNNETVKEKTFTPIHDASAIMYLLHDEIYEYRHMDVDIDLSEGLNRGMTVGDNREWVNYDESYPKVLLGVDTEKFREYLLESINKLDEGLK